jgi:hypothetical protein
LAALVCSTQAGRRRKAMPSREKPMNFNPTPVRTRHFHGAFIATLILALLSVPAQAETKEGEAKLQELTGLDVEKKGLKIEVGDTVTATCICNINPDQFKKRVVQIYAIAKNTTDKPMYYGLHVAFYDKDKKLIGCCVFGSDAIFAKLEPKGFSSTTKYLELPTSLIDKIAHYQLSLVADDKEFGKK